MLIMALAIAMASGVLVPVVTVGASQRPADLDVSRYGGADRYATSLLVAEAVAAHAGGSLEWVVMVSGRNWTGAVIAAPLAGSLGAPVLATPPDQLRSDASEFLHRTGVSQALVVGAESDTEGVGATVVAGLEAIGISVERVTRADQYATGFAVAHRMGTPGHMGNLGRTAVVASGEVFADALVAGAFAARGPHPVLLTPRSRLHQGVASYLAELGIEHVVLMGGTGALHQSVEDSIVALGIEVTRLAGSSRYDTAIEAARFVSGIYGDDCFTSRRVGLARARIPFDSFSAAPLLARLCAPLLLADPRAIPAPTIEFLNQARSATAARGDAAVDLRVFGGYAAISQGAINTYVASFTGAVNPFGADGLQTGTVVTGVQPQLPCVADLGSQPMPVLGDEFAFAAAWSPDCSRVVYLDNEQAIWTSRIDGTERTRLTAGYTEEEEGESPAWSPDGTRIAFVRYAGRFLNSDPVKHIFVINADGTGEMQLTSGNFRDRSPTWSPDSKHIAFSRHNLETPQHYQNLDDEYIAVLDADGSNIRPLTRGGLADRAPSWSPDGTRIAYGADHNLWVMDAVGSSARKVPVTGTRDGYSWSPDGTAIAFATLRFVEDDTYSEGVRIDRSITIAEVDGSSTAVVVRYTSHVTTDSATDRYINVRTPKWAPDGRSIMFERYANLAEGTRTYVAPVPQLRRARIAVDCRPTGGPSHGVGFPTSDSDAISQGTLRMAVLFVDFPDAQASHSTQEELARGNPQLTDDFIEQVSYGNLDLEFVPHHEWLRAPEDSKHYFDIEGSVGSFEIAEVAASLALGRRQHLPRAVEWGGLERLSRSADRIDAGSASPGRLRLARFAGQPGRSARCDPGAAVASDQGGHPRSIRVVRVTLPDLYRRSSRATQLDPLAAGMAGYGTSCVHRPAGGDGAARATRRFG